jgi:hypothetical protein
VVHVAGEVLGADLPVGLDPPPLRAAQLDTAGALLGVVVEVEAPRKSSSGSAFGSIEMKIRPL